MYDTSRRRQPYSSDLSTNEWERLKPLVPMPKIGGRPAKYERLEIINGILYLLCQLCGVLLELVLNCPPAAGRMEADLPFLVVNPSRVRRQVLNEHVNIALRRDLPARPQVL